MSIRWLALALGLAALATQSLASTRVAVYAIVDAIDFEPSSFEPERAWISGIFVVPVPISSGLHAEPARGHLYLSLDSANAAATRADWEALRANAGTGRVVGFGEYWMRCSLVRSAPQLPPNAENANCSAEITVVEADRTRATPEPYPKPSREGVVTVFDNNDDVCPRFGQSSVEIIANLREAHSPGSAPDKPPICEERIGLVDEALPGPSAVFEEAVLEYATRLATHADHPTLLERKRAVRAADERRRPLEAYRAEELALMHRDIFDDRRGFAAARHAFVTKRPRSWSRDTRPMPSSMSRPGPAAA